MPTWVTRLRVDASREPTAVFLVGRELPVQDVLALPQLLGAVYPGRSWVDALGNAGWKMVHP